MEVAELALVVAILSFVVAGLSLAWNIVSWRRSGPQVEVVTSTSAVTRDQDEYRVSVLVRNTGRTPIDIVDAGVQYEGSEMWSSAADEELLVDEQTFPLTLLGHSAVHCHVFAYSLVHPVVDQSRTDRVAPYVTLATGRTLWSEPVPISAGSLAPFGTRPSRRRRWDVPYFPD